jgi:SAM-dependent methyltransferase
MLINALLILMLVFAVLLLVTVTLHIFSGSPWVPSNRNTIALMLKEAKLKPKQMVYDLGCGDARLLIKAEKEFGTRGVGFENAPIAYGAAILNKWIKRSNVELKCKNFFKESLKAADVVFLYLGPEVQKKLAPKILKECRPGTTIISNTFHLPKFKPQKHIPKSKHNNSIYLYKVPKK